MTAKQKTFLAGFVKSTSWKFLRDEVMIPEMEKICKVGEIEEGYTAGEMYAGKKFAQKFFQDLIYNIERCEKRTVKKKDSRDNMN